MRREDAVDLASFRLARAQAKGRHHVTLTRGELAQLVDAAERGRWVDTAPPPRPGLPDPFVQLLLGTFWLACWLYGTHVAPALGLLAAGWVL